MAEMLGNGWKGWNSVQLLSGVSQGLSRVQAQWATERSLEQGPLLTHNRNNGLPLPLSSPLPVNDSKGNLEKKD